MNIRSKLFLSLAAFAGIALLAPPAFAVLTTDNTNIGNDPSYGSNYSAFWRTGQDYTLLTSSNNTYINTPLSSGALMFRAHNGCNVNCVTDPDGVQSRAFLDNASNFVVGNSVSTSVLKASLSISLVEVTGALKFQVDGSGNLVTEGSASKPGGGVWSSTSDIRTKQNETMFTDGLNVLSHINPVTFEYNGLGGTTQDGRRYVGVNAQDIEPIVPAMVSSRRGKLQPTDALDTDIKQVDATAFTFMLINAVNDLNHQVQDLKTQVAAFKKH